MQRHHEHGQQFAKPPCVRIMPAQEVIANRVRKEKLGRAIPGKRWNSRYRATRPRTFSHDDEVKTGGNRQSELSNVKNATETLQYSYYSNQENEEQAGPAASGFGARILTGTPALSVPCLQSLNEDSGGSVETKHSSRCGWEQHFSGAGWCTTKPARLHSPGSHCG